MKDFEIIKAIKDNPQDVIGVKVPVGFQWSMLAKFRKDLDLFIILPLDKSMRTGDVFKFIEEHQKYFPAHLIVLLYDYNQPYPVNYELQLYVDVDPGKAIVYDGRMGGFGNDHL